MMLMRFRPCSGESARMPTAQWMILVLVYQRCARFLQRDAGARSVHGVGDAVAADDDAVGVEDRQPRGVVLQVVALDQAAAREQEVHRPPAVADAVPDIAVARRIRDRHIADLGNVVAFNAVAGAVPETQPVTAVGKIDRAGSG